MRFDPTLPEEAASVSQTHPLREALVLISAVSLVVVAIAIAIAVSVELVAPRIPPGVETRMFSSSWLRDETEEHDARGAALTDLALRMSAHWPDNPYTFRVFVWDTAEPNALALPGGAIAVTTGLLAAVESENELAFVLGHELGHFHNRDHLRGLGRGLAFSLVLVAMGISGGGSGSQIAAIAGELTQRGFGREQETLADLFGLELLFAEYGHAGGAIDLFDHLPDHAGTLEGYLATHPLPSDRRRAIEDAAHSSGGSPIAALQALPPELASAAGVPE